MGGVDLSEMKLDVGGYIALMLTGPHAWRLSLEDALELVTVYEALAPRVRLTTVLLPFNAAEINTLAHSMGLWPWAGSRSVGETICALFPGTGFPDFAAWWVQHSMRLTAAAGGQATHKGPETMLIDDLRARARAGLPAMSSVAAAADGGLGVGRGTAAAAAAVRAVRDAGSAALRSPISLEPRHLGVRSGWCHIFAIIARDARRISLRRSWPLTLFVVVFFSVSVCVTLYVGMYPGSWPLWTGPTTHAQMFLPVVMVLIAIIIRILFQVLVPRAPCVVPWLGRCHMVDLLRCGREAQESGTAAAAVASVGALEAIVTDVAIRRGCKAVSNVIMAVAVLALSCGLLWYSLDGDSSGLLKAVLIRDTGTGSAER